MVELHLDLVLNITHRQYQFLNRNPIHVPSRNRRKAMAVSVASSLTIRCKNVLESKPVHRRVNPFRSGKTEPAFQPDVLA